ncbi:MAG TPA: DNA gyrase subunit A [bacterium]|nr:DNA gyrase subunit A [bacterium]
MVLEQKVPVNIENEMRQSYLDYAMSVIVGRALPDVRDGLKPVHRRVLYTMHENGNTPGKPYRKSARIVGNVMGKYHPHGDAAIYDTIVRMAQDFSMRYPLVDGQGNFGSLDGDPAAAYRYTEVRMDKFAAELLADIEKETVDWQPNYDESAQEPMVLPSRVPNLLVNGAEGIAVGMATKIPPHNLGEVVDALIALIDDPALDLRDLLRKVPGPDFPTGGFIFGRQGIIDAYTTGRGKITVRARITTETNKRNERESVIITEVPYQVNKARLVEEIADLVRDKKIEGISDLRDESDKDGVRVVMELKRDAVSSVIVNQLYKMSNCQITFGIILLCLVDGQPRILNLRQILDEFINFRREVITRRTRFELRKAEERAHILEGIKIALDHLDEVITTIRESKTVDEARENLMSKFDLSRVQAQAILDMRLQKLTGLEREKIIEEYNELIKLIARLQEILANERLLMQIIKDELLDLQKKYANDRRTEIVEDTGDLSIEDLIVEEDMVVTVSNTGYIKRNALSLYRAQHRGGKGKIGMDTKTEDFVEEVFIASTHDYVLIFTDAGRVYWLKVYQIPQAGRASRGKAIINLLELQKSGERLAAVLPVRDFEEGKYIVFATKQGVIKRTDLMSYSNPRSTGIIALTIDEGDEVIGVRLTDGKQEIILATRKGKAIRFKEGDVRKMGRTARGVRGITLKSDDEVVSMTVVVPNTSLLTVCEHGFGKRTTEGEYRLQGRGGQGIITIKTTARNGDVVGMLQVADEDDIMMITDGGKIIRLRVSDIRSIGRNTQGVRLFEIDAESKVTSVARLAEE